MKWSVKKIGDVCHFVRGPFGGSLKKEIFIDDGFAVYEQQHAIYNQFNDIRYFIDSNKFTELKRFELRHGDLIMSCSGTMGKVAIVPKSIKRGIINQALLKITPSSELDISYLKLYMESQDFQISLMSETYGAAIKNVASVGVLKNIKMPLPPLAEQKRIAALLDTADNILRKREKAIAKLDQLAQSVFAGIFADATIKRKVSDVYKINQNKLNNKSNDDLMVPFIPMSAVSEHSKSITDQQVKKYSEVKKGYTPIKNGDLIVAKITPCYENGKMAIVDLVKNDFAFGSTEFHTIRANDERLILYLYYYLMSDQIRISGAKSMKGAAGQRRVPADFFADLDISIPISSRLDEFCEFIKWLKNIKEKFFMSASEIQELAKSLQHQSFAVN